MAAALLPNGEQTFFDANGVPLALGTVTYYIPSTTTPKDTYQDAAATILNANPITLDAAGRCIAFGLGNYRQLLKDVLGNTIWDQVTQGTQTSGSYSGGTTGGSANAQTLAAPTPGGYVLTAGNLVACIAGFTNTGPATLNINATGAANVYRKTAAGAVALVGGELVANTVALFLYDGTQYELIDATASLPPSNLLGRLTAANFNITTDQQITLTNVSAARRYRVTKITVENTSVNGMSTAAGGVYPAVTKGGTALVAAGQVYTGLTNANTALDLTLATPNAIQPAGTLLYLSLTTPQGAAATAEISIWGDLY